MITIARKNLIFERPFKMFKPFMSFKTFRKISFKGSRFKGSIGKGDRLVARREREEKFLCVC